MCMCVCVCPYAVINANISSFLLRNKPPSLEETGASEQMGVLTRLFELQPSVLSVIKARMTPRIEIRFDF